MGHTITDHPTIVYRLNRILKSLTSRKNDRSYHLSKHGSKQYLQDQQQPMYRQLQQVKFQKNLSSSVPTESEAPETTEAATDAHEEETSDPTAETTQAPGESSGAPSEGESTEKDVTTESINDPTQE